MVVEFYPMEMKKKDKVGENTEYDNREGKKQQRKQKKRVSVWKSGRISIRLNLGHFKLLLHSRGLDQRRFIILHSYRRLNILLKNDYFFLFSKEYQNVNIHFYLSPQQHGMEK